MRDAVQEQIASAITRVHKPHPLRVAIAGLCASGKTTLADQLVTPIERLGRPCLRASLDGFHPLGHAARSAAGGYTAESYYAEAFDYATFRVVLLQPLGPGGNRRCRLALNDSYHDAPYPEVWHDVPRDAAVIVDGGFLLRPELVEYWDYVVWLEVDRETSLARARNRDVAWVGSKDIVEQRYRERNFPAHDRYVAESRAPDIADVVIDNRDVNHPMVIRTASPS